jgi:hypothetical protein
MYYRVDPTLDTLRVPVHQQVHAQPRGEPVAELVPRPELPRRIDMQQREGWLRRAERLHHQVRQRRAVLADRVNIAGRSLSETCRRWGRRRLA